MESLLEQILYEMRLSNWYSRGCKGGEPLAPDRKYPHGINIENMYVNDADDVKREFDSQQRLAMMRYSGRP